MVPLGALAGDLLWSIVPTSDKEMLLAVLAMMVNICSQTFLVSNMAALLT